MIDEEKRLAIVFSVAETALAMREAGFPKTAYSKLLRETIFFVWEVREATKYSKDRRRSKAAMGLMPSELDYDHAVPMRIITDLILNALPNREAVEKILQELVCGVLITKQEHDFLRKENLASKMPDDWNGKDWAARYRTAGILISDQQSE